MKGIQITILFSLLFVIKYVVSSDCSTYFDNQVKSYCENIYINNTHNCQYSNGQCNFKYISCSSYKGDNEEICKSIIPSYSYYKCKMEGNTCTEVYKQCSDYEKGGLSCTSLSAGTNQRCVLDNNECKAHYKKCENFQTEVNKEKCEQNIPSNSMHKCVWKDNQCKEVSKDCNEYTNTYTYYCNELTTSDASKKICISSGTGCKEQYKTCALYNENESSKTKNDCESITIYDDLTQSFDYTKLCSFNGGSCSVQEKKCEDFSYSYDCESYTPSDENKICIYSNYQCKEQYKTCALYNQKETSKTKTGCESIKIYDDSAQNFKENKVCSFYGDTCSERDKKCSDINQYECENYVLSDDIICIYSGSECKEQYKTCELYDQKASPKNEAECKAIKLYNSYGNLDSSYFCDYVGEQCIKKAKQCSDISDRNDCEGFRPADKDDIICVYSESESVCKEQYKTCELYNQKPSGKSENECVAIKIYKDYDFDTSSICTYSESTCMTRKKECSEFSNMYACNNHIPNDSTNKKCIYINNLCVEQFKTCEIYNNEASKTKEICESILPYYENYNNLDDTSKCVFTDGNQCIRRKKDCSEITNSYECKNHVLDDSNKRCIFDTNQCKEVYKSCSSYNSVTNKNELECKAIINFDSYGYIDYSHKCIFEGTTCKQVSKTCSDYISGQDQYFCTGIQLTNYDYKNCILKDGNCIEHYTDCPGDHETVSEEICNSILPPNSQYNKCSLDENNKCVSKTKECSEYEGTSSYACENNYKSADPNKKCFLENNKCIDKYIYCQAYKGNDAKTCESIIPYDEYGNSLEYSHKCVFTAGNPNKCEKKQRDCSDFNINTYKSTCESIYSSIGNKQCTFSNSGCSEGFSCLELENKSGVTENICAKASTSDPNKVCSIKSDSSGCHEVDNKSDTTTNQSDSSGCHEVDNKSDTTTNPTSISTSSSTKRSGGQNPPKNIGGKKTKINLLYIICGLFALLF